MLAQLAGDQRTIEVAEGEEVGRIAARFLAPRAQQVAHQRPGVVHQGRAVREIEGRRRVGRAGGGGEPVGGNGRLAAAGAAGQEHRSRRRQDLVLLAAQLELQLLAAGVEQVLELLLAGEDGRIEEEPADAAGEAFIRLRQHAVRRQQELEEGIGLLPISGAAMDVAGDLGEGGIGMRRRLIDLELLQRLQLQELGLGSPVAAGDAIGVVVLRQLPHLEVRGEAFRRAGEGRADHGEDQPVARVRARFVDRPGDPLQPLDAGAAAPVAVAKAQERLPDSGPLGLAAGAQRFVQVRVQKHRKHGALSPLPERRPQKYPSSRHDY